ncbi:2-phosphosulfolactate phosphatase [Bacillus sp. FJAT-27916]|uniref:2-phosphosulfolactate phosphatase n=1 Tax=Bacillaceae TaxID=186817 RepID=UPI0006714FE8|nr:2-phosphosulfolactate phosphatase [Bacillus sp. FJAT-27916]KMY45670.1 2-phosphosulfolactate phosphatase [Bacillus sp. FJAT-27916]
MVKIQLLIRKEDISVEKMAEGEKIAVVLDVLLATTTIVSALKEGAKEVIPVQNPDEAVRESMAFNTSEMLMAGELNAGPIEGFIYPSPSEIKNEIKDKTLILSTTNGTVALRMAAGSKRVYISSLLNNAITAKRILTAYKEETIMIVCSGNSGELSLEDFYGAGHLIACFGQTQEKLELNDAAKAALALYQYGEASPYERLAGSYVGQLLLRYGFHEDLKLASSVGEAEIIAVLKNGRVTAEQIGELKNS